MKIHLEFVQIGFLTTLYSIELTKGVFTENFVAMDALIHGVLFIQSITKTTAYVQTSYTCAVGNTRNTSPIILQKYDYRGLKLKITV